jgi:hypothetical protein
MPTYALIVEAYMPNLDNLKSKPSSYCGGIANATIPSPYKSEGICLVS